MAVGADQGIGHGHLQAPLRGGRISPQKNTAGEVFEIHLMDDADGRWHHTKVLECLLTPPQKGVPLSIPRKLDVDILCKRVGCTEKVDLYGMVDHEVDRDKWIDLAGIAPQSPHGRPHSREVHHARHARKILQNHPSRLKRNLSFGGFGGVPSGEATDIEFRYFVIVAGPQQGLEHHADRIGQPIRTGDARVVEGPQPVERRGAGTGFKRGTG